MKSTMNRVWLKLKLKHRLLTGLICGIILTLLVTQTSLMALISHRSAGDRSDSSWVQNAGRGPVLADDSRWQAGGGGGHLNILRKDLDLSNYTGDRSDPGSRESANKRALLREDETLMAMRNRLLGDNTFRTRDNLEKLFVAAAFLKDGRVSAKLGLEEFRNVMVPSKVDDFLRGGLATPGDMARVKALDAKVKVTEEEIATLMKAPGNRIYHGKRQDRRHRGKTLKLYQARSSSNISAWQLFHSHISQFELYSSDDPAITQVVYDLAHQPIVDCIMRGGGTQLKLIFYFANGARVLFKPMRFPRSRGTLPDHFYFSDYERHIAEIGAFALDRVLGFNRVPPTAGRRVNITHDIRRHAEHDLAKTFFVSPAGNLCFHGVCDYYCDSGHAICGTPEMLEGSFAQYLPSSKKRGSVTEDSGSAEHPMVERKTWRHPWRRSYHKRKKAVWELDNTHCSRIRKQPPYDSGRRLLDLTDMAVFDFLQGNLDRHHYETMKRFGNYSVPLHLDNGRAFGKPFYDDMTCLAPVYQCCMIRYSTLQKLLKFDQGSERLSDAVRRMLSTDLISPVLTEPNLLALDRRVKIILKTVFKCIQKNGSASQVVIDDGF